MVPVELLKKRRQKLADKLANNSFLLLLSGEELVRNSDVAYPFRQESSFWYFTGFIEPSSALVLRKNKDGVVDEVLYVQPKLKEKEIWTGIMAGVDGGQEISGIQDVRLWPQLEQDVATLVKGLKMAYFDATGYSYKELRQKITTIVQTKLELSDPSSLIREIRLIKDEWEVEQMQLANTIAIGAHARAAKFMAEKIRRGEAVYEYQVAAELDHEFGSHGLEWSYPAIVAAGKNACILHYTKHDQVVPLGELVLIDAGCEVNGYAADITRAYPVSGSFSTTQKLLYEIVLQAQLASIKEIARPGSSMKSFHDMAVRVLVEGLIDIGVLKGSVESIIEKRAYLPYFMHGTGHFLGLDVHDIGNYKDANDRRMDITIQPGMAVTVEPGLYMPVDDESVPQEFRGIGIRIEDDIIKTAAGVLNLTAAMPKTIADLESLSAT